MTEAQLIMLGWLALTAAGLLVVAFIAWLNYELGKRWDGKD